jgi:transposase-like protein
MPSTLTTTTNIQILVDFANLFLYFFTMSDKEWIELRIRLVRKDANFTDLAKFLGITRQAVCKWRKQGIPANRVADVERFLDDAA